MRVTSKINESYCEGILPPLPERAISGSPQGIKYNLSNSPFHTVHLWEFTNLHAVLIDKAWNIISDFLKQSNLKQLSQQLHIKQRVLEAIYRYNTYATHISNLYKIGQMARLDPDTIETSVKAVRFSRNGPLESISFPFVIDLYAWRILCHTAGDGSVKFHKTIRALPEIKWCQKQKNQKHMLSILKRWNPNLMNCDMLVKFPKALTYCIIGSIPEITFRDLRTPKFVQFVLNLPLFYRDWKVQFLAAFLVDDGSVGKVVSFAQMDRNKLEYVMKICDQLGYPHSPFPPKQQKNGIYSFRFRALGTEKFFTDLQKMASKDPLLGLWQKHHRLEARVSSYSKKRNKDYEISEKVYIRILTILGDFKMRTNRELQQHPKLRLLISGKSRKWFELRTRRLNKMGLIREVKPAKYRKYWGIPSNTTSEELIQDFLTKYHSKR